VPGLAEAGSLCQCQHLGRVETPVEATVVDGVLDLDGNKFEAACREFRG
jgi:hypothetical protein